MSRGGAAKERERERERERIPSGLKLSAQSPTQGSNPQIMRS